MESIILDDEWMALRKGTGAGIYSVYRYAGKIQIALYHNHMWQRLAESDLHPTKREQVIKEAVCRQMGI